MDADILQDGGYIPQPSPALNGVDPGLDQGIMQVQGCQPALTLNNINYFVKYRQGPWWEGACFREMHVKQVLNNINLVLPVGQLIGLVGSSGSGKTSLLDIIACRSEGEMTGSMTYRGLACKRDMMRQRVSYVIQADRLLPNLTVRETLTYTAYLKLPSSIGKRELNEKVDNVINRMGLRGVADSRVGGAVMRGVSGGEKRRVTIAIQLLKDPDILLLDEPTTGLDSFTSRHLVSNLQQLAKQGKVVLMSLHQPRSDIAKMLHQTALMSRGHVMYFGPTSGLVPYFTPLGFPCPTYSNPLDTYIDLVSVDRRNPERYKATTDTVLSLAESYLKSEHFQRTQTEVARQAAQRSCLADVTSNSATKSPGWFRAFFTVVRRMNLNLSRDKLSNFNRFFILPLFVPFIVILLGRLKDNQASIQDRVGVLYNAITVPPYVALINNVALFPALRDHFYREGLDGLYGSQTFLLAYTAHILPAAMVGSVLFASALYWIVGLDPDPERFGMFVAVVFLLHVAGELFTCILMGAFRNSQLVNSTTGILFLASGILATGVLRSVQNMSEGLQYLTWATIHKYASEIVMANEFHGLNLTCDQQMQGLPCIPNGDIYLNINYPGAEGHIARNFEILAAIVAGYLLLAILSFKAFGLRVML